MLNYKHVLLATDLSEYCGVVAERAQSLAKDAKAKLSVIHVIEHSPVAYGGEFSIPIDVDLEHSLEEHAKGSLNEFCDKYGIQTGDSHLANGSVKVAVTELAEKVKADLIVVGTHGHHGFDILLGSRANAILHLAKCDVLVVRIQPK